MNFSPSTSHSLQLSEHRVFSYVLSVIATVQFLAPLVVVQMLDLRLPASRVPRLYMCAIHLVDLLEAEALRLGDEEEDVEEAESEHAKEDEQNPGADASKRKCERFELVARLSHKKT